MNSISKELQEEIIEALNFTVNAGYYDEKEILEVATEYLSEIFEEFDLPVPSSEVITEIIGQISERKLVETKQKNFEKLQKIFDQLNREGIIAIDYAGFDMSEGHEEVGEVFAFMKDNDIPRYGYCFFTSRISNEAWTVRISIYYLLFVA